MVKQFLGITNQEEIKARLACAKKLITKYKANVLKFGRKEA